MREIDLSELPALSRWPARLLGIEAFDVRVRAIRRARGLRHLPPAEGRAHA